MGAQISSPYYLTDGQYFVNGSNIVTASWTNVSAAFASPVASSAAPIAGYDWTKAFPGSPLAGHSVNLTISREMSISEDIVQDATTVLSSLTFGTPSGIMADENQPKAMDPSWFVCRHVFISTKPEVKQAVDGGAGCSFLSSACQDDLKTGLTKGWGQQDDKFMCGALAPDAIPPSCVDSFGYARQDVMGFDSAFLANSTIASAQVSSLQQPYSWRIGTQYHAPGSAEAYAIAANRTFLVATVWGYSASAGSGVRKTPDVSFACLSSGEAYSPPPPPGSSSTATSTTVSLPTGTSSTATGISTTQSTSAGTKAVARAVYTLPALGALVTWAANA
ncbi:hypothetical protein GQ53DRAFT_803287 [Thozetella sp. PMI_491]|nr:hypothetical protein GQ53DRAFT_803287 [Thozetella sp. PMI_491]